VSEHKDIFSGSHWLWQPDALVFAHSVVRHSYKAAAQPRSQKNPACWLPSTCTDCSKMYNNTDDRRSGTPAFSHLARYLKLGAEHASSTHDTTGDDLIPGSV